MTTAWFLGAGFSRGLGAPLFRDLFRGFPGRARLLTLNPDLGQTIEAVLNLYRRFGVPPADGIPGSFWRDPEEFIDVLESAAISDGGQRELLKSIVPSLSVEGMVDLARRALAIECSFFLRGADPATERWQPYLCWARALNGEDTIVSFNYDRVLELLKEKFVPDTNHYGVIVPSVAQADAVSEARHLRYAPVLKLHGSVDWVLRNGDIKVDTNPDLAVTCTSGNEIVLAVPGPEKAALQTRSTGMKILWDAAQQAVRQAGKIVFLGYRFPVTDAFARLYFLKVIRAAAKAKTLNTIEIVLGPNEHHPDVERMKGLLSFACKGTEVKINVLPLWVEDYLSFSAIPE